MNAKTIVLAGAIALLSSAAGAASLTGATCGNKVIGLSQDGMELVAAMCQSGNSTGGQNSPIGSLGWVDLAEVKGSDTDGILTLNQGNKTWSLSGNGGYSKLGISVKEGNGFAFYILDTTKALSGMFGTGNSSPSGAGISHVNAWGMGLAAVPLPAAGWLLLAGLGGLCALGRSRRRT